MISLSEDQYGSDPDEIFYPNVSSCLTITIVLTDGTLIGTHLSYLTPQNKAAFIFNEMLNLIGGRGIRAIFVNAKADQWQNGNNRSGAAYEWDNIVQTAKTAFGAPADVLVRRYDTTDVSGDSHIWVTRSEHLLRVKIDPHTDFNVDKTPANQLPNPAGSSKFAVRMRRQVFGDATSPMITDGVVQNTSAPHTRAHRKGFFRKLFGPNKTRRFLR